MLRERLLSSWAKSTCGLASHSGLPKGRPSLLDLSLNGGGNTEGALLFIIINEKEFIDPVKKKERIVSHWTPKMITYSLGNEIVRCVVNFVCGRVCDYVHPL